MKILQCCIITICCILFTGIAAGYTISFAVEPAETTAGNIVTITGTSNIPAGYGDEAILYREVPNFLPKEVGRYPFTINEGGYWGFAIDTTGFAPATYKVQLPKSGEYPYGSSAVLMRTFIVTAPPQTSPQTTTIPASETTVPTPEKIPTLIVPPEPTTSPVSMEIVFSATVICALAFAYALRRQDK